MPCKVADRRPHQEFPLRLHKQGYKYTYTQMKVYNNLFGPFILEPDIMELCGQLWLRLMVTPSTGSVLLQVVECLLFRHDVYSFYMLGCWRRTERSFGETQRETGCTLPWSRAKR